MLEKSSKKRTGIRNPAPG